MSFFGDIGVATRNGLKKMVEARQNQVNAYVNSTLSHLDDETLKKSGISREDLKIGSGGHYPL